MDSGKLGLAGLLVMVGLGLGHGYEIVSKNQHFVVALGDEVSFTCTVSGTDFNIFKTGFRFMKGEHEVSVNEMIKEPFKATNRYESVLGGSNNNVVNLNIKSVTAAEHDTYHCLVEDKIVVNYTVVIPEEVESVVLSTDTSEVVNGQKVFKFEADMPAFVQCEVKGGRPKPHVTIHRNGDEDITDQFENPVKSTTENKQPKEPLEVTTHHLILKNDSFLLSTDFNGQNLTCKANVPVNKARAQELGLTSLKKFDTALMEITYAPKVECDTEKETVEGTKQFRIECVVKANPPINMQEIVWSFDNGDNTTQIKHVKDQVFEDGQYETFAVDNDADVTVTFEIKNVNSSDFKSYTLQVKNDLGMKEHMINVFRKTTTQSTTTPVPKNPEGETGEIVDGESAARKTAATIFSLVISIILATLV